MGTLQGFFDAFTAITKSRSRLNGDGEEPSSSSEPESFVITKELLEKHGSCAVDFRGEAITFKAATEGILATLAHCVAVMHRREESYRRTLEREQGRRWRVEERMQQLGHQEGVGAMVATDGCEEGPNSVLDEDEFHDAVETSLDRMEEECDYRERLRQRAGLPPQEHPLWPEIHRVTAEQLDYTLQHAIEHGPDAWQVLAKEGPMRLYRKEKVLDGVVVDPCKALHEVTGVTAYEILSQFWDPYLRFEWDVALQQSTILDRLDDSTFIYLQVQKRLWPMAQRDTLFWSRFHKVPSDDPIFSGKDAPLDTWIVCNHSTEHKDDPKTPNCIRLKVTITFACQTFVSPPLAAGEALHSVTRDRLLTKIFYCATGNPGGWVPPSIVRVVFKREFPRFIKSFMTYVSDNCRKLPIAFDKPIADE